MRARVPGVEVLDPDLEDPRLADVGESVVAWADGDVLTIAVRRRGKAPYLFGTVGEPMRPAGRGCWALRVRVPDLEHACVEYGVLDDMPSDDGPAVWQGPRARRSRSQSWAPMQPLDSVRLGRSKIAAIHPVRFWSPPEPRALLVCADGDGVETWAAVVAQAGEPVALVGIESEGLTWQPEDIDRGDELAYDPTIDPRACAYLPSVDPPYFARHMRYVVETVLPWADKRLGSPLPRLAFGVSNGAAWAAAAGAMHPDHFVGVLAFSLGQAPPWQGRGQLPAHAFVAGKLEPEFCKETTSYARKLRRRGVPVRLRTPVRGHDFSMWLDEFLPALRWILRAAG